jgi:hypothetical protein
MQPRGNDGVTGEVSEARASADPEPSEPTSLGVAAALRG